MKYIPQYFIILIVGVIGEVLNAAIPAPIPACVYGIVILFFLLFFKAVKHEQINESARFLINVQPIMFIPAGVGLIVIWDEVKNSIVAYVIACVVTTILIMVITGKITELVIKMNKKG